jgi:hypothetical protein
MYETVILPVVLYGCETLSLTLREYRLRMFENRVLRRASKLLLFARYNQNGQVKENEMGRVCSTPGN